jgi:hypothetical protein
MVRNPGCELACDTGASRTQASAGCGGVPVLQVQVALSTR